MVSVIQVSARWLSSATDARAFALGVQFHPEWKVQEHPPYLAIFRAFGEACRRRAAQR